MRKSTGHFVFFSRDCIGFRGFSAFLVVLILAGCATGLRSTAYADARITVVTHPGLVDGLELIDGYTAAYGVAWSLDDVGIMAANSYADQGYHDMVVLVELLEPGQRSSGAGGSVSRSVYRIGLYRNT